MCLPLNAVVVLRASDASEAFDHLRRLGSVQDRTRDERGCCPVSALRSKEITPSAPCSLGNGFPHVVGGWYVVVGRGGVSLL